jgi:hypothetical protein
MNKINFGRVLLGGIVAGIVLNVGEFLLNGIILAPHIEADMKRMGLTPPGNGSPSLRLPSRSSSAFWRFSFTRSSARGSNLVPGLPC